MPYKSPLIITFPEIKMCGGFFTGFLVCHIGYCDEKNKPITMVLVWLTNYKQQNNKIFTRKKQNSQGTHELHQVISKLGRVQERKITSL